MRRSTILLTAGGFGLLALALGFSDARPSGAAGRSAAPLHQEAYQTRRLNTITAWPWDISPDARHLTIIDWGTGDLALMDLVTGEVSRVTHKGSWEESNEWSGGGKFSPDGRRIAHAWVSDACLQEANEEGTASDALFMEIRVSDTVDQGDSRILLPCTPYRFGGLFPADWSPDSEEILLGLPGPEDSARFALLNVADGTLTEVGNVPDGDEIRFARFSPNGRHIVYSAPGMGEGESDVFFLPLDGGGVRTLIHRPGRNQVLGWEDNGNSLVFQSEDGLSSGVFRVSVRDNVVPTGEPEIIRSGLWRVSSLGSTDKGFAYLTTVGEAQVHTATLDLETRRLTSSPAPVEDPSLGASGEPAWSPDGRWLAYVRMPTGGGQPRLVIRSVEGGEARELPFPLTGDGNLWWKPGSTQILALGVLEDEGQGLFEIDLESGGTRTVLSSEDGWLGRVTTASMSADARTFVIAKAAAERDRVTAYHLETGEASEVPAVGSDPDRLFVITAEVSPDGRILAYTAGAEGGEEVWVVPLSDGAARRLYKPSAAWGLRRLTWIPDGSAFLVGAADFSSMTPDAQPAEARLLRFSREGGEMEDLMEAPFMLGRFHPDGSWIAFTRGGWKGEVWLMGNGS